MYGIPLPYSMRLVASCARVGVWLLVFPQSRDSYHITLDGPCIYPAHIISSRFIGGRLV